MRSVAHTHSLHTNLGKMTSVTEWRHSLGITFDGDVMSNLNSNGVQVCLTRPLPLTFWGVSVHHKLGTHQSTALFWSASAGTSQHPRVWVISCDHTVDARELTEGRCMAIGLSHDPLPKTRFPGFYRQSCGYYSFGTTKLEYVSESELCPKYGTGDVVGCGVYSKKIFWCASWGLVAHITGHWMAIFLDSEVKSIILAGHFLLLV